MRVTIASRIFSPEPAAAAFRLEALANALADAGHDVTVLTSTPPPGVQIADDPRVAVRRRRVLRDGSGAVRGYVPYASFDVPLAVRLLLARRPDVVVAEPPPTTGAVVRVVCAVRRIPYVYYAADVLSDAAANSASAVVVALVRALERWVWRGARAILSVSDGVTSRLRELGVRGEIRTVGNAVDPARFSAHGPAASLDRPYLIYAGTASEVHGAAIFAFAFRAVAAADPSARLVFAGQGTEAGVFEALAAELPTGAVTILPRLPSAEIAGWLRGASAALASVRPGAGYEFAFPTKLYAAVLCGAPVISVGAGPARRFVDEVVGEVVDYDEVAVVHAMRRALGSPPDAARRARIAAWGAARISASEVADAAAKAVAGAAARRRS